MIWKGFMKIYHWNGMNLTWKVGNGKNVLVGIDAILGLEENFQLSPYITNYLADISYFTLAHIKWPICHEQGKLLLVYYKRYGFCS